MVFRTITNGDAVSCTEVPKVVERIVITTGILCVCAQLLIRLNPMPYAHTHKIPVVITILYATYGTSVLHLTALILLLQRRTPFAVEYSLVFLKMGVMLPETC
jgi:hypothetical protein